jgi:hypothetical protein
MGVNGGESESRFKLGVKRSKPLRLLWDMNPKSARGLAHSGTLTRVREPGAFRQVLDCGSPLPLWEKAHIWTIDCHTDALRLFLPRFTLALSPKTSTQTIMEPSRLIVWAVCIGIAWLIFASLTGADDWLKSLVGKSNSHDLEQRIQVLEKRVEEMSKK